LLPTFGPAVGERVADRLDERGVTLHLGRPVESLLGDRRVEAVDCGGVDLVSADAGLLCVGVEARVDLAVTAGAETGESGALAVDAHGRTSLPDVYATGDCAEVTHAVTGAPAHVPLESTARQGGRAVGATVGGVPTPVPPTTATTLLRVFDVEAARTGVVDLTAVREAGFEPVRTAVTTSSRAAFYPGGGEISVSLTADEETGRLLGGAMIGPEGVAGRIDALSVAVRAGLTLQELCGVGFGFAPPLGPSPDPVVTAALDLHEHLARGTGAG
jgi:NADPH-dependent 2,4-dienoyl-CoA reductase/sulfur reductase-like enzyme